MENEMLSDKLTALKEHTQYMINMLALGQTLMSLDHATLTDLFNDAQPAQGNSLKHADKLISTLQATNADLLEALEILTDALSRGYDTVATRVATKNAYAAIAKAR